MAIQITAVVVEDAVPVVAEVDAGAVEAAEDEEDVAITTSTNKIPVATTADGILLSRTNSNNIRPRNCSRTLQRTLQ